MQPVLYHLERVKNNVDMSKKKILDTTQADFVVCLRRNSDYSESKMSNKVLAILQDTFFRNQIHN